MAVPALTIRYQLARQDGEYVLTDPKTESSGRRARLNPTVVAALRTHKARQNEERLAAGPKWREADLVFTTESGQPINLTRVWRTLNAACDAAGVRRFSAHSFRRFALTQVAEALGIEAARRMGGHMNEKMTERYVTETDAMLEAASRVLGEARG